MQTPLRKLTTAILVMSLAIPPGYAQDMAGGIRCTVQDAEFSGPVPLAVVRISELLLDGKTSDDGHFLFESIAPGAYTVIISKSGYERQIVSSVVVVPGQLTEVNAQLKGEFVEMEEFVVRDLQVDDVKTETGLLALRETSLSFQDSISRELMSKAGASDAAGALRLVTGASVADGKYATVRGLSDRYVGTSVNDIRMPTADPRKRAVQIDIFPSGVIESMSVFKTFTPEHPGDWSGGGINIRTLSIPDKSFLKLSSSRGFNPDSGKEDSLLTYEGAGTGAWGRHVNSRGMPVPYDVSPRPQSSFVQLADADHPHSEEHQQAYDRTIAFDPAMGVTRKRMPEDFSARLSGGYRGPLFGDWEVGSIGAFSYSKEYSARTAEKSKSAVDMSTGSIERKEADSTEESGEEELKWSLLGSVGIVYQDNHKITLTGLRNRIATEEAQLVNETNRVIYTITPDGVLTNKLGGGLDYIATEDQVLHYTERSIDALQISGEHKDNEFISTDLGLQFNWFGAYNITEQEEPDMRRFKNYVYEDTVDGALVYGKPMTDRFAAGGAELNALRIWRNTLERNGQYGATFAIPFRMDVPDLHGTYLDPQAKTLNWSEDEGRFEVGMTRDRTVRQYRQYTFTYQYASADMALITEPPGKPQLTDFPIIPKPRRPPFFDEAAYNAAIAAYLASPAYLDYLVRRDRANLHNAGNSFTTPDRDELWTDHFTGDDYVFIGPYQDQLGWYTRRLEGTLLKNIDYDGVQALDSGYWMLNYPLTKQLKVLAGARLEMTDMTIQPDYKGEDGPDLYPTPTFGEGESFNDSGVLETYQSSATMGSTNRAGVRAEISDVSWLRSMSLAYEVIPNMQFRYNWSQTIARPTFRELTPVVQFDFAEDEAFIGNSELELVTLVNKDVRWEWFRKPGEVIALSWFDKKVSNPIEYWDYGYNGVDYTTALNLPDGTVNGWEAEFRTSFGLPGGWPGKLTVGLNYADISAEVRMPFGLASELEDASVLRVAREQEVTPVIQELADAGKLDIDEEIAREATNEGSIYYDDERGWPVSLDSWRPMINQPDYIYNLNLSYDLEESGSSISIFLNEVGDTLRKGPSLGDGSAYPSVFKGTTRSLNLSASQKFAEWWKFTFRIKNISDPDVIEYYLYPDPSDEEKEIRKIRKIYKDGVSYSFALEASW